MSQRRMQADPRTFSSVSGKRDHLSVETQPVGVTATIHVEAVWEHRRRIPFANSAAETPRRCHSLTASILGMPDASVVACFPRSRQPGGGRANFRGTGKSLQSALASVARRNYLTLRPPITTKKAPTRPPHTLVPGCATLTRQRLCKTASRMIRQKESFGDQMKYSAPLDGVRTIAILPVLLLHAGTPLMGGGRLGVDVFFVLSGFLITRILAGEHHRTGRIDIPRFYVRRLNRLWPPMLAMLVVFMLTGPLVFRNFDVSKNALDSFISAIYMADYSRSLGLPPTYLAHMWSLSIEEHFYLIWPIAMLLLLKLRRRHAMGALIVIFIAATMWRHWEFFRVGWSIYNRFDTHATGLILGCIVGLSRWKLPSYISILGLAGLIATIAWSSFNTRFRLVTVGFTAAEISTALLILAEPRWLGAAPLAWIGKMSYGIYLWHYPAARVLRQYDIPWEIQLLTITAFGVAMATLSYYTLEAHFRRRRSARIDRNRDDVHVEVVVGSGGPGPGIVNRI